MKALSKQPSFRAKQQHAFDSGSFDLAGIQHPALLLVRHGESEGNIGLPTDAPADIRLTDEGHAQAAALAAKFETAPGLIVVSPYLRTAQTAAPLIARFPQTPREVWPVHEFTYLNPVKYSGTTQTHRGVFAKPYWQACQALYNDGGGAESFAQFMGRVDDLLHRLRQWRGATVAAFTHGYFMHGVRLRLLYPDVPVDNALMAAFRDSRRTSTLANTTVMSVPF